MSYYDRYSWYKPNQQESYTRSNDYYTPPAQQQQQQDQGGMNAGDMYNAYQNYQSTLTPAYSASAANPMVSGANFSATSQMSPAAMGDPFSSGSLYQTPGASSFSGTGALGSESGALSGTGGGGGSWMASAGPWAALAAAIAWNEDNSRKQGRRADSRGERIQDALSGKALELDADHYGDKIGGVGGDLTRFGGRMGNPEGVFNQVKDWGGKGFDYAKSSLTNPEEHFKKGFNWLGDLF